MKPKPIPITPTTDEPMPARINYADSGNALLRSRVELSLASKHTSSKRRAVQIVADAGYTMTRAQLLTPASDALEKLQARGALGAAAQFKREHRGELFDEEAAVRLRDRFELTLWTTTVDDQRAQYMARAAEASNARAAFVERRVAQLRAEKETADLETMRRRADAEFPRGAA